MNNVNLIRGPVVGLASATSANGTARDGTAIQPGIFAPGSIGVRCSATIVTGSVVATFKVQVSQDNSTFYDLKPMNNAASVTITATGDVVLSVDSAAHSWRFLRVVGTLSGATTAAGDLTSADYYALDLRAVTR